MSTFTRRNFIASTATLIAAAATDRFSIGAGAESQVQVGERIRGLVLGSALGDALGGPIEFQARDKIQQLKDPPKVWRPGEVLDAPARQATAQRLRLRSYADLRPGTESYGQWNTKSLPGTITDDTRHKLILLYALHQTDLSGQWPLNREQLAKAYLDWPQSEAVKGRPGYPELAKDWLEEWHFGTRWVLGERDLSKALPPERMWQSLPTCCGQMTSLPLAAIFAGQPSKAYLAAYTLGYFDNGFGKDLNAALVAGLAQALVTPVPEGNIATPIDAVHKAMRETDPLRFRDIRWSERAVDRWLNLALSYSRGANREPARLFAAMEQEFAQTTKWEAQVPFVVAFACLDLAAGDPLAAIQLSLEWGHDSDSYAQLVGAVVGALHGPEIFPSVWREAVVTRLKADHGVDLEAESRFLLRLQKESHKRTIVAGF